MKRLTKEAENDKADFELYYKDRGCVCFLYAPCDYCTHPGNPIALEHEDCWEEVDDVMSITRRMFK